MDWKSYLNNTEVIIHSGGLSERWYPITHGKIPKPVTEIGKIKRPLIDWILLPYVRLGIRKFFISLWSNPEAVVKRCEDIKAKTGIEFVYLIEPSDKRLGKAGVVKHYLSQKVLDKNKHKLNVNAADLVNYDIEKFIRFHLSNGFSATMMGSKTGETQFDKLVLDKTGRVIGMDDERTVKLPENELANVGIGYFDAKLNNLFMKIPDNELPADWETCSASSEFFKVSRGFDGVESDKTWFPLKNPHDYKKVRNMDLEKWFKIKSADDYLGKY